jgi:hypothetical protein
VRAYLATSDGAAPPPRRRRPGSGRSRRGGSRPIAAPASSGSTSTAGRGDFAFLSGRTTFRRRRQRAGRDRDAPALRPDRGRRDRQPARPRRATALDDSRPAGLDPHVGAARQGEQRHRRPLTATAESCGRWRPGDPRSRRSRRRLRPRDQPSSSIRRSPLGDTLDDSRASSRSARHLPLRTHHRQDPLRRDRLPPLRRAQPRRAGDLAASISTGSPRRTGSTSAKPPTASRA